MTVKNDGTGCNPALQVQLQARHNAEEISDFLSDLGNWEKEAKKKDEAIRKGHGSGTLVDNEDLTLRGSGDLPPVRNAHLRKKKKSTTSGASKAPEVAKKDRIASSDYRGWDRFDVDAELEKLNVEENVEGNASDSSEYEELSEGEIAHLERQRNLQISLQEKDKGNLYLREAKYREAVACYTRAIEADPTNHLFYSNRAMGFIRLRKWKDAEMDATHAIELNSQYCKSYSRRASARTALKDYYGAMKDLKEGLRLEPANKQLMNDYTNVNRLIASSTGSGSGSSAVTTHAGDVEPKKYRRILIEEVNTGSDGSEDGPTGGSLKAAPASSSTDAGLNADAEETPLDSTPQPGAGAASTARVEQIPAVSVPEIPEELPPKTSFEFERYWKELKGHPDLLYTMFSSIDPEGFPQLFQQVLTADMLQTIVLLVQSHYLLKGDGVVKGLFMLEKLTHVRRFDMTTMFMGRKEKGIILEVFVLLSEKVKNGGGNGQWKEEDVKKLGKKYGVNVVG